MARLRRVAAERVGKLGGVILIVCCLSFAACGRTGTGADGGDASAAPSASVTSEPTIAFTEFCAAAEEIAEYDEESQGLLNDMLAAASNSTREERDPEKAFGRFLERFKEYARAQKRSILDAYGRMAADAPPHLQDDVRSVEKLTVDLYEIILKIDSLDDLEGLEQKLRGLGMGPSIQALFRVDKFSRSQCDVTLAD